MAESSTTAPTIEELVDAYEHTVRATIALAEAMSDNEWARPTWLAGWSVADNVAHIAALERQFLGEDVSAHALPPLAHVTNPLREHMEKGIDVRRSWTRERVVADLRDALDARLVVLRDPSLTADTALPGLMGGTAPAGRALPIRVFDCWAHEQDIRAAASEPGNLDSPAARVSYGVMVGAAAAVAKKAALGETEAVRVVVTGPIELDYTVAGSKESGAPSATITTTGAGLFRLSAGRGRWSEVPHAISGDRDLAERVLVAFAVTP